jgi:hypothetical protein
MCPLRRTGIGFGIIGREFSYGLTDGGTWCDLLTASTETAIKSGLLGRLLRMRCSRSRRLLWSTTPVPRRRHVGTANPSRLLLSTRTSIWIKMETQLRCICIEQHRLAGCISKQHVPKSNKFIFRAPCFHFKPLHRLIRTHKQLSCYETWLTSTRSHYSTSTTKASMTHSPYLFLCSAINPRNLPEDVGVVKSLHQVSPR